MFFPADHGTKPLTAARRARLRRLPAYSLRQRALNMTSALHPESTTAWDQYWQDGRLASCGGAGGINYQPVIAQGWRRFFDTLAEGFRILDICTGNGAVARLAAEVAAVRNVKVTIEAVDSAAINPMREGLGAEMIRFLSRTPAENLPFPESTFDVIVGQYALEYTDVERTLVELRRVSRPTVNIRFVTHAADGVTVQEAKRQLADVERLAGTGIFEAAETLVRTSTNAPAASAMHDARRNFQNALQSLKDGEKSAMDLMMYRNVGMVLVHAIEHLHQVGSSVVLDKIRETASAIRSHEARLSAMSRAALDTEAAQSLAVLAERLWGKHFTLDALVRSDGAVFGWVLAS